MSDFFKCFLVVFLCLGFGRLHLNQQDEIINVGLRHRAAVERIELLESESDRQRADNQYLRERLTSIESQFCQ